MAPARVLAMERRNVSSVRLRVVVLSHIGVDDAQEPILKEDGNAIMSMRADAGIVDLVPLVQTGNEDHLLGGGGLAAETPAERNSRAGRQQRLWQETVGGHLQTPAVWSYQEDTALGLQRKPGDSQDQIQGTTEDLSERNRLQGQFQNGANNPLDLVVPPQFFLDASHRIPPPIPDRGAQPIPPRFSATLSLPLPPLNFPAARSRLLIQSLKRRD
jgi:hypothetical protein